MDLDLQGQPVITAADLDRMTPEEVDDAWRASIVTDPDALPASYVDKLRAKAAHDIAKRDIRAAS